MGKKEIAKDFLFYLIFPTLWIDINFSDEIRKAQIKQNARDIIDLENEINKLRKKGVKRG